MKNGTLSKNLTDAFMLIMALIAVVTLVGEFVDFEEEYLVDHPYTGEEIQVVSFLDDPYNQNYLLLAAAFGITALLGFATRKCPEVGLFFNVAVTSIVLISYDRRFIGQMEFMYILFAFFGLAGAIVYTVCYRLEKKEEANSLPKETETLCESEGDEGEMDEPVSEETDVNDHTTDTYNGDAKEETA